MLKRSMTRLAVALVGAGSVVSAAAMVGGTAHGVPANICVNVSGTSILNQGSSSCDSSGGTKSHAIAIGPGNDASATDGTKSTGLAIGSNNEALADDSNRSGAVVVGSDSTANANIANKDAAVTHATNSASSSANFGNHSSAVATKPGCSASLPVDTKKQHTFC